GARLGILVKGVEALEQARAVDVVVFDKTGTLTEARMAVTRVVGDAEALRRAAAAEAGSEHPIGRAIVEALDAPPPPATAFEALAGHGVRATIDGTDVWVGTAKLMAEAGMVVAARHQDAADELAGQAITAVFVAWDGHSRGVIGVADTVKPGAADAVAELRALGIDVALLTGDHHATARAVAAQVGIDTVVAEVLPDAKQQEVARLQAEGRRVAMVGDGVNDGPALAQADLGIALGAGTDVARAASDITILRPDLGAVGDAVRLSRRIEQVIRQNLAWAFGYNVLAIPVAAAGLLDPAIAGAAMALSSVSVVANSLRLNRAVPR
ncbi:MAG: HAD-IC family P-type ATPase, partial [Actinobacteria bacterium]|nr:HAD-IC family P-type ATPase [Actinomycetota bacterium]